MWLHVPASTSSASAPAGAGSISASSWHSPALAASSWWRGRPSPSRTWWQRCERVSWLSALCGTMSEPSTAGPGVASWMASLAASRASRTASPDESAAASTSATCGARRGASSSPQGPGSSSSRTSPACSRRGLTKSLEPSGFGETYAGWVSRLRADCSARRKSARATSASGSSSSGWPTPTVRDYKGGGTAMVRSDGKLRTDMLDWVAESWATPRASDGEKGGPGQAFGAGGMPLAAQASHWATPTVRAHRKSAKAMRPFAQGGQSSPPGIEQQAEQMWRTPRSHEAGQYQRDHGDPDRPTPTLTGQAFSLLAPPMSTGGETSSHSRRSLKRRCAAGGGACDPHSPRSPRRPRRSRRS